MSEKGLRKPGWAWPERSRKAHFFDEGGRSLCGRWFFLGDLLKRQTIGIKPGHDDCVLCWHRAFAVVGATVEHLHA